MQWQFPATKVGAASSAFMSFRSSAAAAREEDPKEAAVFDRFSLSGFRPPPRPSPGDAFDGAAAMKQVRLASDLPVAHVVSQILTV